MKTMTDRSSHLLRFATAFGMDPETRAALAQLETLAGKGRRIAVAGNFMPDAEIGLRLAAQGICQNVGEADFGHYTHVVIPFSGISPAKRKQWQSAGVPLTDLTSPQVRRAHVALGLLRMDGAQPLVIGRHSDPESKALAAGNPGTRVLEDTTDTAQLVFSPAFGVVCQTTLSPRRVSWLVQQLRLRYNDARVTFLDTAAPAMTARDQALEKLMADRDRVIIVGQPGEATCEALAETALRKGKPSVIVGSAAELDFFEIGRDRVGLTAGGFALDATIREVADALQRR
jgi:4-hydroxy-3-methylbut-2-enyl diphosphate reductase IspH